MKNPRLVTTIGYQFSLKVLLLLLVLTGSSSGVFAQCPQNIDFEEGNFNSWQLWVGHTSSNGGVNAIIWDPPGLPVPPVANRHTMLSTVPGDGVDYFGNFPKNCPNGSGHSIQLGNATGGHEAEGASYTFTIPAGQNQFNLIYNYAVIFQDPGHDPWEQPRLQIEVKNLTDDSTISCSSFDFIASSNLPGFYYAVRNPTGTPVWCKGWSANSIKLDNLAGKTIRLFFKTADCTLGQHFGYAYIDVNTQCSSAFVGATYCPDDAFINVTAPYGYETYTWWNAADPTTILATTQTINFTPPPAPGTILKVAITPYAGYGCVDTLTAILQDTLTMQAQAGPDKLSCNNEPVQLGVNPRATYVYSWSPPTGLSDPHISNPIATPSVTTQYVLTVTSAGGGCLTTDTVTVSAAVLNDSLQLIGPTEFCYDGSSQTSVLVVLPADSIQWYRNNIPIQGANQTRYNVVQTGTYHAMLFNFLGCSLSTATIDIIVNATPVAGFNTNALEQCFKDHQFVFTNTTTLSSGTAQYLWNLGDGTIATTTNVNHSYSMPGDFVVRMIASTDRGCADTTISTVKIFPFANADFYVAPVCTNIKLPLINKTKDLVPPGLNYLWNFGNGQTSTLRNPVYSYPSPGTYTISLSVSTNQCPIANTTMQQDVVIDAPAPGISYPVKDAVTNFPEPLHARQIGNTVLWSPPVGLDNRYAYNPNFRGINSQLYTIQLKTPSGCLTVDTQLVKTHKKIEIYVPTAFTPGSSNGLNDYLRPVLMGFDHVNYFRIYNRWGKMIFQMQGDRPGWDGKLNGVLQEMQTVVWMIEAVDIDGNVYRKQGTTVLIR